jgi:hypothetical protein
MRKICAVIVDTYDCKLLSTQAIYRVLKLPNVSYVYTFSESPIVKDSRVKHIYIPKIFSIKEYSNFIINKLPAFVEEFEESHCLIFQWDGFPIWPKKWDDTFLDYDYIGAPWYNPDANAEVKGLVGNGGFCLVSKKLFSAIKKTGIMHDMNHHENDDIIICKKNRSQLEAVGIRFAPIEIAGVFSREERFENQSFGFHGYYLFPLIFSEGEILNFIHELGKRLGNNPTVFYLLLVACISKCYRKVLIQILKNKSYSALIKKALVLEQNSKIISTYCLNNKINLLR